MVETGVDKLLRLVQEQRQLSTDDAAKALGVAKETILEWAGMLQEDNLVDVHYRLANTVLVPHENVEKEELQPPNPGEAFIRKIDRAIEQLGTDTAGVERFRHSFERIKHELGGELEEIQSDLEELAKYSNQKSGVMNDAVKQERKIEAQEKAVQRLLSKQQKRYDDLLAKVEKAGHKLQPKESSEPSVDDESAKSLTAYVAAMRGQGESEEQIAASLRQVGWQEQVIIKFLEKKENK